jgi:hypothetical protein
MKIIFDVQNDGSLLACKRMNSNFMMAKSANVNVTHNSSKFGHPPGNWSPVISHERTISHSSRDINQS